MTIRKRFRVQGVVQGVGFRPFVYQLATRLRLGGSVFNSPAGVVIEAEGLELESFEQALREELPPLARIDAIEIADIAPLGDVEFTIRESVEESGAIALVPPDASVCDDCLRDVSDPDNRRFGYPFTNMRRDGSPRVSFVTTCMLRKSDANSWITP